MQQQQQEKEINALRIRLVELETALQEQSVSHEAWIRNNLEEAQQIIDNIVGIKGITEDPLKVAAELEARAILTLHTDTTNAVYRGDINVIAANTEGTLERQFAQLPQEELYGY
jgi:hypothetical protein